MVIFKHDFLTYSFKLRELGTDYLCELPKLASLKKISVFCACFLVKLASQFSNTSFIFSGIYAIPIPSLNVILLPGLFSN